MSCPGALLCLPISIICISNNSQRQSLGLEKFINVCTDFEKIDTFWFLYIMYLYAILGIKIVMYSVDVHFMGFTHQMCFCLETLEHNNNKSIISCLHGVLTS